MAKVAAPAVSRISEIASEPRAGEKPRSPQKATMCTNGTAMAVQQQKPAAESSTMMEEDGIGKAARNRRGPHIEGTEEQQYTRRDAIDDQCLAPADLGQQPTIDLRPDEAGERRPHRDDRHRRAAATAEPALDIVHGRREGGGIAEEAERNGVADVERQFAAAAGLPAANQDRDAGNHQRHARAGAVGQPAHKDTTDAHGKEAHHVGERRHRTTVTELRGDFLQRDDRQIDRATTKADAEHRHKGQPPGVGAVDSRTIGDSRHSRARAASAAALASSTWSSSISTVTLRSLPVKGNGAS